MSIYSEIAKAESENREFAVVTVVATSGSTAREAGTMMLVYPDGSIAGTVLGHISLRQIPKTGEKGRGLALAGTIVGWVGIGLAALLILLFVIIWVSSVSTLTTTY